MMRAATERGIINTIFRNFKLPDGYQTIFNFKKKGILGIGVMSSFIYCKLPYRFIKNIYLIYVIVIGSIHIYIFEFRNILFPKWKLGYNA